MQDYQLLFERMRDVVYAAHRELARRNYGNAEQILSEALQKGVALSDDPPMEIPEHCSLAYMRRHGL